MCERGVGDWTNCNILTPSSFVFSSTSFSFCWAAQSGILRAHSPLLGAGSHYSILSPTHWLQLTQLSVALGYIIVWLPPASCERHICTEFNPSTVKAIPWYLRPDAPVIYTGVFLIWQPGRGLICYIYFYVSVSMYLRTFSQNSKRRVSGRYLHPQKLFSFNERLRYNASLWFIAFFFCHKSIHSKKSLKMTFLLTRSEAEISGELLIDNYKETFLFVLSLLLISFCTPTHIVIHRQICFVLSELSSVARHTSFP